jgi:uncharacterized protein (DUF1330 family)
MPAYWLARSKINDPVEYKKYTDRVRSAEYQEASAFRRKGAGEVELVIVEGGDATAR